MIARQAQIDHLQLSPETNKAHHEAIMALYIARANNGCRFHNLKVIFKMGNDSRQVKNNVGATPCSCYLDM